MLQKLGKKHRLLPAGLLWPGELAHWRTRGLSSPELPVLLLGNIKGLGTVLLRRACQPLSLSLSPCLSVSPDCGGEGYYSVGWSGSISASVAFTKHTGNFFFLVPFKQFRPRGLKREETNPRISPVGRMKLDCRFDSRNKPMFQRETEWGF